MGNNMTVLLLVKARMTHMAQVFWEVDLANTSHWSQIDTQIQSQAVLSR